MGGDPLAGEVLVDERLVRNPVEDALPCKPLGQLLQPVRQGAEMGEVLGFVVVALAELLPPSRILVIPLPGIHPR